MQKEVMQRAWKIARDGQRKFGGKVSEYIAEALKIAWALIKKGVQKVIKLVGSEKQVKWAEDIRKKAIEKIDRVIKEVEGWATSKPLRAKSYEKYKEYFENLKNEESAAFWIEKFGYKKLHSEFVHAFNDYVVQEDGEDRVIQKIWKASRVAEQIDNKEILGM